MQALNKLFENYEQIQKYNIDIQSPIMPSIDFEKSRQNLILQSFRNSVNELERTYNNIEDHSVRQTIRDLLPHLSNNERVENAIKELKTLEILMPQGQAKSFTLSNNVPTDIYAELEADANELNKTMNAQCYRSAVIICGRMIEVALHRKYFEATQIDLLEKSPGIGLGNLIGKMKDREIEFDPAITQQIHLINQVRIFSVHKKQTPFCPSAAQAQAIVLYTQDVISKLF